ncbi:hypothetical protein Celly_0948 [Cellulophaga lytica DSM 7489]|uniref:Uncharacterized protein n=1 Tax=Cellulophaga lytica (strain ATCC 23178 / DSM 7489 / JCM 8516 / NBRC 14961 / NCIMB 1423 / VKM B-1433 / Cy l20) TaxID=867900 RepID=F0RDN1_CELLC|nr:hypothetical protein [Cellulophaga lytica]ADY28779.1 hypothetical protein Celly_0948 [Cellulophaga lytica DSM 7489]WQG77042.1 hypothetical protein SR888_15280 [Cellulophaga lytica]
MAEKHDIDTYSKLELGASFFLQESFHHIHSALSYEYASILFAEELEKIEPSKADRKVMDTMNLPNNAVGILQSNIPDILTDETLGKMSVSWQKSQLKANNSKHKFGLNHRIDSIEILGHLNNFGFFIETLINRHLLFLKQTKVIDDFSYARISVAKVMERIIYIFKEDLTNGKTQLNEIVNLFSLRNKTVHFTPDNAKALKPKISKLIQIWNQSEKLIKKLEKQEKFNEEKFSIRLANHIKEIKERWN